METGHAASDVTAADHACTQGWQNPAGDKHFRSQRKRADSKKSRKEERIFYNMMCQIGDEMQKKTECIRLKTPKPQQVLDLCMAPGGYTKSALKYNRFALVSALTLPLKLGGYQVITKDPRVTVKYLDMTMLVDEFDVKEWDPGHADADNFLPSTQPYSDILFDLVFCDGQVLRTHSRADYRDKVEATRLTLSQLVISMRRIREGGTLVMLLHRVESRYSMDLIHCFSQFADVQVFKPEKSHALRSSFYMIAQNIRPTHDEAQRALARWKSTWRLATFDAQSPPAPSAEEVQQLLQSFGDSFIRLAEPIWMTQLEALRAKTDSWERCNTSNADAATS